MFLMIVKKISFSYGKLANEKKENSKTKTKVQTKS